MKKKNGFIATSVLYTFFIVFITMFLALIVNYVNNQLIVKQIENESINKLLKLNNTTLADLHIGDYIKFSISDSVDAANGAVYADNNVGYWVYAGTYDNNMYFLSSTTILNGTVYAKLENSYFKRNYPLTINTFLYAQNNDLFNLPFVYNYNNGDYSDSKNYNKKISISLPTATILKYIRDGGQNDNVGIIAEAKKLVENTYDYEDDYNTALKTRIDNVTSAVYDFKTDFLVYDNDSYYNLKTYRSGTNLTDTESCSGGYSEKDGVKYNSDNTFGYIHVTSSFDKEKNNTQSYIDYCYSTSANMTDSKDTSGLQYRLMATISKSYGTNTYLSGGKGLINDPYILESGVKN